MIRISTLFNVFTFVNIFLLLVGCSGSSANPERDTVAVSILPIKYWVDEISGGDFETLVVVPPGSSPETYEPTTGQMKQLMRSRGYIQIGLIDFEHNLTLGIRANAPELPIIDLSAGMQLIEGMCGHEHHHHQKGHLHSVDPHTWLSPIRSKIMVEEIASLLIELKPDSVEKYRANQKRIIAKIDEMDSHIRHSLKSIPVRSIMIYHPHLSYYCDDYGLEQIAIEQDGKEPSVTHMKELVGLVKEKRLRTLFYQAQLHEDNIKALVYETGIRPVAIDPLAYDWMENLQLITREIADTLKE